MTDLIRFLFPSFGDVVAALLIALVLAMIVLEARRQENEHYEELKRRARAPRFDADDANFRIR